MRHFLTLFTLLSLFSLNGQDLYFPPIFGDDWETVSPSEFNWCSDSLDALQQYLEDKGSKAFIILKDGKIAVEWYYDQFTQDSVWYWASAGKSLTAFLVGIAQHEGLLDLNTASSEYLGGPGWTTAGLTEESQIKVWNQLTMTTGLDDDVEDVDCWLDTCLNYLEDAGTRWAYHNAPYTLLDSVISTASEMSLNAYHFNKIGLKTGSFGAYIPIGYNSVFFSTPRVMARFGLLTLAEGNWNGNPVLDDPTYFQQMVNTSQNLNKSYGYLWWLNGKGEHMIPGLQFVFDDDLIPNAPDDLIAALGRDDQKCYVVPSQNLVVIRMGNPAGIVLPSLSQFDNVLWQKISNLVCEPSSLNRIEDKEVTIVPNPSNGFIQIETDKSINKIVVFDLYGKRQGIYKTNQLNLLHLENGTYFLRIDFENGSVGQKQFIKL